MYLYQAKKLSDGAFVLGVSILHFSTIFLLDFENVPRQAYFLFKSISKFELSIRRLLIDIKKRINKVEHKTALVKKKHKIIKHDIA